MIQLEDPCQKHLIRRIIRAWLQFIYDQSYPFDKPFVLYITILIFEF